MERPIKVIAEFTADGEVKPYRIQVTENGNRIACNVESFLSEKQRDIIKYRCKIIINNSIKTADICYYKDSCCWKLNRIN